MSNGKINERILKGIRENCKNDEALSEFLINLIYEEAEHSGQWWWKDIYRKKIEKYSEKWGDSDEN
jgi:hypothetical protein